MTNNQTALIVGATGNLGSLIAHELVQRNTQIRALVRNVATTDAQQRAGIDRLTKLGVEIVEGDISKNLGLDRAVAGVDIVVSTVQGSEDVIVDGQRHLLEASKKAGVSRFIPSDFSGELRNLKSGEHYLYNLRIRFGQILRSSGIPWTSIQPGAFMFAYIGPFIGMFDLEKGTVERWGTGDEPIDLIDLHDAARYTAEAALDPKAANNYVRVVGEVSTHNKVIASYKTATGRALTVHERGSVEDLRRWIDLTAKTDPNPMAVIPSQYVWGILSQKLKLSDFWNSHYPNIQPKSMDEFFHETTERIKAA